MRGAVSGLLVLLAVVAGVVAVPSLWVAQHLADEDGFVASAAELTDDPEVRSATAELLAARLVASTGLPDAAADRIATVLDEAARRVLVGDDVSAAWEESLRLTHRSELGPDRTPGTIELEVAPLAALVTDATGGVVPTPDTLPLEISGGPTERTLDAVEASPRVGATATAAAAVLALLALVVSPRRGRTLAWLGAGAVVVAGVVAVASRVVADRAVSDAAGLEATLTARLADVAQASLDGWLLVVAGAGAVVLVVGLVLTAARRS